MQLNGHLDFYTETGTEGGHWAFVSDDCYQHSPDKDSPYDHLFILEDGDYLEIIDETQTPTLIINVIIDLEQYPVFTEHCSNGFWKHSDQKGIDKLDWERYFFGEYRARLTKGGGFKPIQMTSESDF
jgi:hypothetical protein